MGSSCFLHTTFLPSSSSTVLLSPQPFLISFRNVKPRAKFRSPLVFSLNHNNNHSHQDTQNTSSSNNRRVLIFLGVSILPFFKWNPGAPSDPVDDVVQMQTGTDEQPLARVPPPNPFMSLINAIGTLGLGIFGALYALARSDKIALDAKIDALTAKLKEKDDLINSMEKNFECELLKEQEEWNKQLTKAKKEQASLMNQLNSAKSTIAQLGHALQTKKAKYEELNVQMDSVQVKLMETEEDRLALEEEVKDKDDSVTVLQERMNFLSSHIKEKEEAIKTLNSSFAEKDLNLKSLAGEYDKTSDELARMKLEDTDLKKQLESFRNELNQKNSMVEDVNLRIHSLLAEQNELRLSYECLVKEHNELRSSSKEKADSDATLLEEKESQKNELEEKYMLAMNQANGYQALMSDLAREKDGLKERLDLEARNMNEMKRELLLVQEALSKSRNESSDYAEQLRLSSVSYSKLESEVFRVEAEVSEGRKSLERILKEETHKTRTLLSEFGLIKETLDRTKAELLSVKRELSSTSESRNSLQKELVEVYGKAEIANRNLQEEKTVIVSLNKQLQSLEEQITNDTESRRNIETDLVETTKALDEIDKCAQLLTRELEMARIHINNVEDEKRLLSKSLDEQETGFQDAKENMEEAQKIIMRLGTERVSLERKVKGLEMELASSKCDLLKLKSIVNNNSSSSNIDKQHRPVIMDMAAAVPTKRFGTRSDSGS